LADATGEGVGVGGGGDAVGEGGGDGKEIGETGVIVGGGGVGAEDSEHWASAARVFGPTTP
jgi:hypothetical protein